MGILIVLVLMAAAAFLGYVSLVNRFARLSVKIGESASGVDVALTRRWDTLTKMIDVTKGYARYEAGALSSVVKLRQGMSMMERNDASARMDELTGRLNVLVENYPDLKASESFTQLQQAVREAEEHLQAARRVYNMNVSRFNQLLASWPAGVVGRGRGYVPAEFFQAEERKRGDVSMEF